jgi:hypothetical protein
MPDLYMGDTFSEPCPGTSNPNRSFVQFSCILTEECHGVSNFLQGPVYFKNLHIACAVRLEFDTLFIGKLLLKL